MVTGVKESPSPKARSAARSTASVAAVISGPMPSPSMTTMRTLTEDLPLPMIQDIKNWP